MMGTRTEETIGRLAAWAVRDRLRAIRRELVPPWDEGPRSPEAELGHRFGLGLALGATLFGAGLALIAALSRD